MWWFLNAKYTPTDCAKAVMPAEFTRQAFAITAPNGSENTQDQPRDDHHSRVLFITVLAKGLLGLIQLTTAAALYFGVLQHLPRIAQWLVARELSENPNDFIAAQILSLANIAPTSDSTFYKVNFSAHGFLHIGVVTMLLSGAWWFNYAAISVLSLFVIFQIPVCF
jgi:uncharacterized membrane protein